MTDPGLRVSKSADGARAVIRMAQPKGNVLTGAQMTLIAAALEDLSADPHLKLVTIEAAGPDFCFGASVPEHAAGEIERVLPQAHALIHRLLAAPFPTGAVVRGRCLGGGFELALACDFIFAAGSATFGLPEIALGVFPPAAAVLLPARVGLARATRAVLTGAAASAREWHDSGLLVMVSEDGELETAVERWFTATLAPRSAVALRHATAAVRASLTQQVHVLLPQLERLYLDDLMKTADAREGVAAFLEKRRPEWMDR